MFSCNRLRFVFCPLVICWWWPLRKESRSVFVCVCSSLWSLAVGTFGGGIATSSSSVLIVAVVVYYDGAGVFWQHFTLILIHCFRCMNLMAPSWCTGMHWTLRKHLQVHLHKNYIYATHVATQRLIRLYLQSNLPNLNIEIIKYIWFIWCNKTQVWQVWHKYT